jgi:cytochrome c-type biogenesis protein CcmH/NrfG
MTVGLALAAIVLAGVAAAGALAPLLHGGAPPIEPVATAASEHRRHLERERLDLDAARLDGSIDETTYRRFRSSLSRRLDEARPAVRDGASIPVGASPAAAPPGTGADGARRRPFAWLVGIAVIVPALVVAARSAEQARAPGMPITGSLTSPVSAPQPAGSLSTLEGDVRAAPDDVNARLALARAYFARGSLEQASQQYLAVLQLDRTNVEARARLGLVLALSGRGAAGLAAVDAALREDPTYAEAHFFRGVILLRTMDRAHAAASEFRRYLADAPNGSERAAARRFLHVAEHGPANATRGSA